MPPRAPLRTRLADGLRGPLLGPVLTLVGGTAAGQLVSLAARPVLTRLFTPEAFGVLGFYAAAVATLATAAAGRYEDAVPLPASRREADALWGLALGLGAAVSAATVVVVPFRGPLAAALGRPEVAGLLALVPLGVLGTVWGRATEVWLGRADRFGAVSASRVAHTAVTVPTQLGGGLLGGAAGALVGGHLAGRVAATAVLIARALRVGRPSTGGWGALARRYRRFPAFSMPSGFLNTLSTQLPAFFLLAAFEPDVLGLYVLAFGTLAAPLHLVGTSVAQVFFQRAAEAHRDGTLAGLTETVFARLGALGLFPLAALAVAGPAAFAVVFGAEWRASGVYAALLAPWLYFVFVSSPLSSLFDVLERQPAELAFNAVGVAARVVALWAGGRTGSPLWAVGLFGAVSAALWLGHAALMLRWSGVRLGAAARAVARHAVVAAGPLAALAAVAAATESDAVVVAALVATGLAWLGLTARFEPDLWGPAGGAS